MKRCDSGDFVVKYGDWVEVFSEENKLIYSFKATSDMCQNILTRFLVFRADMPPETNYKIKRRRA